MSFFEPHFKIRNIEAIESKKIDCIMYGNQCGVGLNNIFYFGDKVFPCMRFVENDKYSLGGYCDSLFAIEKTMQKLIKPVGECYYEEY